MKGKRVGKKDANTKTTQRCVMKEETEVLDVKPLYHLLSNNRSTRQSIGIHGLARGPPSSYSNNASRNYVLSSPPDPTISSMLHLPSLASYNAS